MAMKDEANHLAVAVATTSKVGMKSGGDVGDNGACIDRQPDKVVHQTGLSQTAGRGSRSGPGARNATGIRVLKAGHNYSSCLLMQSGQSAEHISI